MARETHHEWDVDVTGAFPKPQPTDSEIAIIDDLVERYGDALRTFVLMKREERKATLDARGSADLHIIPKFVCHILERNAGRFLEKFDKLLQVANE